MGEFGTRGFPCARGRVCEASRAAYRMFCPRNAWSGFPGRCARAGRHGKPRRFGARVTSSAGISRHECRGNSARCPTWGIPREQALVGMCSHDVTLHIATSARFRRIPHAGRRALFPRQSCREIPADDVTRAPSLRGFPCMPARITVKPTRGISFPRCV